MEFGLSPIPGFLFLCPFLRFGSARIQLPAAPKFFIFSPSSYGVSAALLFFFRTALFPSELFFFLLSCCLPSEASGALLPLFLAFFLRLHPSYLTALLSYCPLSLLPSFLTALFPARLFSAPPFPHAFFSRLLSRTLSFRAPSFRAPSFRAPFSCSPFSCSHLPSPPTHFPA